MVRGLMGGIAAVLLMGGAAGAADVAAIEAACVKTTYWTEKACQCVGEKAASLSPGQRDYYLALLTEDTAGQTKAQAAMTVPQFADVSTFIVSSGTDCQGE